MGEWQAFFLRAQSTGKVSPFPSSFPSRTRAKQVLEPNDLNRSRPWATNASPECKSYIGNFKRLIAALETRKKCEINFSNIF